MICQIKTGKISSPHAIATQSNNSYYLYKFYCTIFHFKQFLVMIKEQLDEPYSISVETMNEFQSRVKQNTFFELV